MQHSDNKKHLKETILLSLPLIASQIGHVVTGMVDVIFLGRLGTTEQAAGILSTYLFVLLLVFSIGFSYGLTPLIASAHVNKNTAQKAELFKNALFLNTLVALFLFLLLFASMPLLNYMQQPQDVVELAKPFFSVIAFSIIPVTLFFTCKQYTEGLSNTKAGMYISVAGNIINIILNYGLIYGKLGLPELNYMGSAWATFFARCFMGAGFLIFIFYNKNTKEITSYFKSVKVNIKRIIELWKIGINSAMQFTFEVAAFCIASFMTGKFGKEQIDAHGITINIASFTYMFASGISGAATIRIGNFSAENKIHEIKKAGYSAISLALICMGFFVVFFILFNQLLPKIFTKDFVILELSSKLMLIAALFQLFDGLQVTCIGILRGMKDVKFATLITLIGYWLIAIPLAYVLGFIFNMEVIGIWYALLASLIFVGIALFLRFNFLMKRYNL